MLVKGRVPHIPAPPVTVGWLIAAALGGFWIYRTIVDLIRGPG